eukprot:CAMPEP_0170390406 /NCGR_PEP_ID=MMETSP0117_2-20130122/19129_1 /TAXON_ID=400756 /ORGANISM="Durinskia baltica, Strain CSIRO CS-38" /LENGTH=349 /DNA_ID=CAMNT_0010646449 /DNA_START=164 /DNA_END=1213 /DNA_ORIENTATION=+
MPKRKFQPTDPQSIYTFRLVNGESFDVQGVKILVEQLVYKSIEYTNKKLLEGPPPSPQEESSEPKPKVKVGRRRYSREEKKIMIGIYDKYPIKEAAMEIINKLEGFPRVTPGMILTWKRPKPASVKKMGRQVDHDFEEEVLRECEKASNHHMANGGSNNTGSGAVATTLGLSYALVRECAMAVWDRLYPDESGQLVPRWKINKTTQGLKFSHKWVVGLLKRVQAARDNGGMLLGEEGYMPGANLNPDVLGGYMLQADEDDSDDSEDDEDDGDGDDDDEAGEEEQQSVGIAQQHQQAHHLQQQQHQQQQQLNSSSSGALGQQQHTHGPSSVRVEGHNDVHSLNAGGGHML